MRVFTFISDSGACLPLVQKIRNEGHRALLYINDPTFSSVGENIVEKIKVKEPLIDKDGLIDFGVLKYVTHPTPDCIVMDMYGSKTNKIVKHLSGAHIVFGGGAWEVEIENSIEYKMKCVTAMNIKVPLMMLCNNYDEAIDKIKDAECLFSYEVNGFKLHFNNNDALIEVLRLHKESGIVPFILREEIDGIPLVLSIIFNGENSLLFSCSMYEDNFLEGNRGINETMGCVLWIESPFTRLYKESFAKFLPALRKIKYRGIIKLHITADKDTLLCTDMSTRFIDHSLFALLELFDGRINDLIYGLATGIINKVKSKGDYGMEMNLLIPPYPTRNHGANLYKDILIYGVNSKNISHVNLVNVYKKNNQYVSCGSSDFIGIVSARGDSNANWSALREARRRVFRTIDRLVIPGVMYRRDIGNRIEEQRSKLHEWGWI